MDKNEELVAKARQYIEKEMNPFFRDQVNDLLREKNFSELNDRFYTELAFGTGGLRGVIGGGYNRMNPYMVRKSTQGLANYVKKFVADIKNSSAVIAYDSRNFSDVFAREAALVLCANGIKTFLFTSLRPTPELSFAVRELKATVGIVVTASHNPPEYNGYKVYWNDGAQVVEPHDNGIISEVRSVSGPIPSITVEKATADGLLKMIDKEIDERFISMVMGCSLRPELVKKQGKDLKVVFTPLHGTGAMPVSESLRRMGIEVIFVPEQKEPDGNFPTVPYPNPEEASAMKLSLELARKVKADLVIGTDPDADRLGIAAPDGDDFVLITGNQLGALLADYIFSTRKELGTLPKKAAFVKTIVTTELQRLIAESYGAQSFDVLTGFKYIGEKIREFDQQDDSPQYMFGGEESYGYLVNTAVRDKDAVSAATMTAEMTLYHRSQGRTLLDQLNVIWKKYGYFEEALVSGTFKGESGLNTMKVLMEKLRKDPPATFASQAVSMVKDYRDGTTLHVSKKERKKNIDLPSSNVIQFILADESVVTARPSGTEPKIKFYASCRSNPADSLENGKKIVKQKILSIRNALNTLINEA
ncbi:MAG TPA: phospho-sugar mutase [Chitinispirillaceae bacterium]|nr:phospho-sugar mutase [Chitinispirillaceae bacterium]